MEEDARRLILELRALQARIEEGQRQLAAFQQYAAETTASANALKNLSSDESLFPFGAGVIVKAKVADSSKVFVYVGAGVIAEKTVGETVTELEKRAKELLEAITRLQEELSALVQRSEELNARLAKLQKY